MVPFLLLALRGCTVSDSEKPDWPSIICQVLDPVESGTSKTPARSDYDLNENAHRLSPNKQAAVLVPLIERPAGWQILLTRRTMEMPTHAGQIAFPGGQALKNETLAAAALREFEEETGVKQHCAQLLGRFERYETASGFNITPFVARLTPPIAPRPDPREVDEVFEVPLGFLMNTENHQQRTIQWQGQQRHFYAMPWNEYFIWGATAGMIRALALRLGKQNGKKEKPCCA